MRSGIEIPIYKSTQSIENPTVTCRPGFGRGLLMDIPETFVDLRAVHLVDESDVFAALPPRARPAHPLEYPPSLPRLFKLSCKAH